ncbi:MAG: prepilin-type N-terminal cleavage/methylation domain-containing protein [Alphaproteobacteria bacterium]|nr:prepilin-type N-terminal cleavage/methylation domain-containing protein [Alphaproteobacteria bacterium]
MKNIKRSNERGFTLIELSIVLILIGLIIGGVLKGQELVNSTRLKMTVTQWDAVKAAVNTFQDKFDAIPGDYSKSESYIETVANGGAANGDGNGRIVPVAGTVAAFDTALGDNSAGDNEHDGAWQMLFDADVLSSIDTTDGSEHLPGKITGSYFHMYYGTHGGHTGHWLRLQSEKAADTTLTVSPLSPKQVAEIDRKFDDDVFTTGIIQAGKVGGTALCAATTISDEKVCTMVFELF